MADLAGMRLAIHPNRRVTAKVMKNPEGLNAYSSFASFPSISRPKNTAASTRNGNAVDKFHGDKDVFKDGERRDHLKELEYNADVLSPPCCQPAFVHLPDLCAVQHNFPVCRVINPRHHIHQGGFPAAGLQFHQLVSLLPRLGLNHHQINTFQK